MRISTGLTLLLLLSCCNSSNSDTYLETVESYYEAINTSNFDQIRSVLADSITLIEGGYIEPLSIEDFYARFQWDSVFTPSTTLSDLRSEGDNVFVIVSTSSPRFAFLRHDPLTCETIFGFASDKIRSLETGACPGSDWPAWEARRDSMVAWIDVHHQELSGFLHDRTKVGAERYLKAIALYQQSSQ